VHIEIHGLWGVDARDAMPAKIDKHRTGLVAAGDHPSGDLAARQPGPDPLILRLVPDRADLHARMPSLAAGQSGQDGVEPAGRQLDQPLDVDQVVKAGVTIGDDHCRRSPRDGRQRGPFDHGVQPAAIAPAGNDPDPLRGIRQS
jgi:hypothetical protein